MTAPFRWRAAGGPWRTAPNLDTAVCAAFSDRAQPGDLIEIQQRTWTTVHTFTRKENPDE